MDIFEKIEKKIVTTDDFNELISEATPESLRDRARRRVMPQQDSVKSHQDTESGHAKLTLPTFNDRIQPKRKPIHKQMNGGGRIGHRHSTREQRTESRIGSAIGYIKENYGKEIVDVPVENKLALIAAAKKIMALPNCDREWLNNLCIKLEAKNG